LTTNFVNSLENFLSENNRFLLKLENSASGQM